MSEILFLVEDDPEGGYTARVMNGNDSIFTDAGTTDKLKANIMDALRCHFNQKSEIPPNIRLQYVKTEETIV